MLRFMEYLYDKNYIFFFFFFYSNAMKASTELLFIRELMRLNDGRGKKGYL